MLSYLLALRDYVMGVPENLESHTLSRQTVSLENGSSQLFPEALFTKLLALERKRAERSRKPFALMLLDASGPFRTEHRDRVLARLLVSLSASTRETDVWGWHKAGSVLGVILTELGSADADALRNTMLSKLRAALRTNLEPGQVAEIHISFHVFPEQPSSDDGDGQWDDTTLDLYPDLQPEHDTKKAARFIKRLIDLCGSLAAVTLLSPLFLAIAVAIKLTSKGPILFKQTRIGQYGKPFTFLKFRSMYFLNNPRVHQEYVKRLIAGSADARQAGGNGDAYKLHNDPRVTPLGRFLRRASLDELPQFFNVLRGEMSLVGPRPPIPYETDVYDIWHRRRFFEGKPGITGLWQVKGRSRVTFDEMVRLDIQYMRNWSLGLDLKILFETPWAVFFGKGAH
jgi:lipopolysaccharide/colanic/teichoic acid biosynthesis glycosyltransferase